MSDLSPESQLRDALQHWLAGHGCSPSDESMDDLVEIVRTECRHAELESLREEVDRFRRPNERSLSTSDPIVPLPTFQPQHLLGLALLFREWCRSDLWGGREQAELAARQVETAYHIITALQANAPGGRDES